MKSVYTDFSEWPYRYLHDRAIEAFIESAKGLAENYTPGRHIGEVSVLDKCDIGFDFNDRTMVYACFLDMLEHSLLAFDLLPYDIDEKIYKCFGHQLPKHEHNRRCAEYIDWAFSRTDASPVYGWDMKAYLEVCSSSFPSTYGVEIKRLKKLYEMCDTD